MQKINLIADSNFLEPLTLKEKEVQKYVLEHWEIIFPHLQLIKDEFELEANTRSHNDSRGRVDILAFNPIKNCLVIIEIKRNFDINIESQANDYKRKINKNFDKIYLEISQILKFDLPAAHKMEKKADLVLLQKDFTQTNLEILEDSDYNQQITLLRYELWKNAENICFVFEYLNNEPKFKQNALTKKAQELPKKPDLFAPPPVLAQKEEVKPAPLVQNEIIAKPAEIIKTDTDQAWWDSLTDAWKRVIKGNLLFKKHGIEEKIFEKNNGISSTFIEQHLKKWKITDFSLDLDFDPKEIDDLEVLYAKKSGIISLEPITRLSKLKKINFSKNNITDISPLKNLLHLVEIDLHGNKISDLNPLENLQKLVKLNLYYNYFILNLKPLENLQNLVHLDLTRNNISDLKPLENLQNLVYLDLPRNNISDLKPLENLQNLVHLRLYNNNIESLESLKNLINLKEVSLSNNQITNLKGLDNLVNLEQLWVEKNKISDLSPLVNLPSLKYLRFTAKRLMNLSSLLSLPSLQVVHIWKGKGLKDTQNVLATLEKKEVAVYFW